ncbi:hypothetical protein NLY33_00015 [Mesorhizobium sp. C432A]|uniref:hypothetical protein n=1 Tax=Mesorhizobium sp. C432A TaxID=2956836 RepID=UPI0025752FEE|nr:hypothetical protein [Mesorhizobium sp. C432A]WJI57198.1 hypothetical protein NLY33_00015 [Mesorhizobium sp. C432A]
MVAPVGAGHVVAQHAGRGDRQQGAFIDIALSAVAVGTSSTMATLMVPVVVLPLAS